MIHFHHKWFPTYQDFCSTKFHKNNGTERQCRSEIQEFNNNNPTGQTAVGVKEAKGILDYVAQLVLIYFLYRFFPEKELKVTQNFKIVFFTLNVIFVFDLGWRKKSWCQSWKELFTIDSIDVD